MVNDFYYGKIENFSISQCVTIATTPPDRCFEEGCRELGEEVSKISDADDVG